MSQYWRLGVGECLNALETCAVYRPASAIVQLCPEGSPPGLASGPVSTHVLEQAGGPACR